jgi:putative ATP-dependent endonuclease of the OLD family
MRISRISIENHRRLADLNLDVRQHLVLVGPNDGGKSSLLRCLELLLGASTAQLYQRVVPEDFRDTEQPFIVEADLVGFEADDEALFPDEISVDPTTADKRMTVRLVATLDAAQTLSIERIAPGAGTGRQISRAQLVGLGWNMLGAAAQLRDLRSDRRSVLDDILTALELGSEKSDFDELVDQLRKKLETSEVLGKLRADLAAQLTKALPMTLAKDDLLFLPGAAAEQDVLNDVRLHVNMEGNFRSYRDQSDGMRALYAVALYDLVSESANMVGIDEPETHLHPTSQRSLARMLRDGPNQKLIATHSPDILGAFDPECVVSVRGGGSVVQPAPGFLSKEDKIIVEWWVPNRLEPLTAQRIIAVEGISDRIILTRIADLTGRNLDRLGVSVVETGGSGSMGALIKLFGADGFEVPLSILIDADAANETATKLGVSVGDLNQRSVWVSSPDLEAEYVSALGADAVWKAIKASTLFSTNERNNCTISGPASTRTDADIIGFCGRSKYKVRAAMIVAEVLSDTTALMIQSINNLLAAIKQP